MTDRRKALHNWISQKPYGTSKMFSQNFIFYYECLSKAAGDNSDFSDLKLDRKGFAFVDGVDQENPDVLDEQTSAPAEVNEQRAKLAAFLVQSMGNGLPSFTQELHIWKVKKSEIIREGKRVPVNEEDFSIADAKVFRSLKKYYPESYIDSVHLENFKDKVFVVPNGASTKLFIEEFDEAAEHDNLQSPIFASFDGNEVWFE
ncbi:MAG: hypothetical protein LBC41_09055 [Clostridiales bacterium]|jgi:hypothetical protein|nr:hypothetical protein [Clostridiales bacterium]